MSVYDNLAFGLRRMLAESAIRTEIDRTAAILGLGDPGQWHFFNPDDQTSFLAGVAQ
jgi:ABC-type Fe3+/spermidine/putrescine transport system ATPase subunit